MCDDFQNERLRYVMIADVFSAFDILGAWRRLETMFRVITDCTGAVKHMWLVLGHTIRRPRVRLILWISLVNGLVFAVLLWPLLFGGQLVYHTDAGLFTYPFITLFDQRIFQGGLIWNDLSGAGFPSLYVHGYLFQPFLWILLAVTGPIDALHFSMLLYAWLGSFMLAFALLRMGYRPAAAWLGSIAFPFVLWGWLFEPTISFFLPLFGAAALAVSAMDSRPTAAAWCCGAIVALSFLSLQSHYAVLLLIAVFLLWFARRLSIGSVRRVFVRTDMTFGFAASVGLLVGALRVLPLTAYAMLSTRKDAFQDAYLLAYTIRPGYFFRYLLPSTALPVPESYFANTPFLGIGIMVLALLGAVISRRRSLVYVCLGVCAVTLSLTVPSSFTFGVLRLLPGVAQLGDPTRYLILGQLALIALAVEGLHMMGGISMRRITRSYSLCIVVVSLLLLLIGLSLLFVPAFFGKLAPMLSLRNREMVSLVLGGLLIGALLYSFRWERLHRWYGHAAMACVAVALLVQGYIGNYDAGFTRAALDFVPPTTEILSKMDAVVFPFLAYRGVQGTPLVLNPELHYLVAQALGIPNTHLFHRLQNITMFDHIQPQRLDALLAAIGSDYSHTIQKLTEHAEPSVEQMQQQLLEHWQVLERLGVSYVLSPIALPSRTEVMSSLLSPEVLEDSETGALITVHKAVSLYVYEVSDTRQHISAPKVVVTLKPDEEAARNRVLDNVTSDVAVIECTDCPMTDEQGDVQLTLLEKTPVRTHARVHVSTERWIVIRRQLLPGWRVLVDGHSVPAAIADSVFIAVPVPAGTHDVVSSFSLAAMLKDSILLLLSPESTPWFS